MYVKMLDKCLVFLSFLCFLSCGNDKVAKDNVAVENPINKVESDSITCIAKDEAVSMDDESVWKRECSFRDSLREVSMLLYFKHLDIYSNDSVDARKYFGDFELDKICHINDFDGIDDSYKMKFANFAGYNRLGKYHLIKYYINREEECRRYVYYKVFDDNMKETDQLYYGIGCRVEWNTIDDVPDAFLYTVGKYCYHWKKEVEEITNQGDSLCSLKTAWYSITDTITGKLYEYEQLSKNIYKVDNSGHFYIVGVKDTFNVDVMLKEMK